MKKISSIILLMVYLTVTSGIVLNIHYCMGELSNVAIRTEVTNTCSNCGMENDGCCHDDVKMVKLTDSHQSTWIQDDLFQISVPDIEPQVTPVPVIAKEQTLFAEQIHSPPGSPSRSILFCVFRI